MRGRAQARRGLGALIAAGHDEVRPHAKAQVPAMRVNRIDELLDNPQLKASGLLREREHPTEGRSVEVGMPVRFSAAPRRDVRHPPHVGEHSHEVAQELGVTLPKRPGT